MNRKVLYSQPKTFLSNQDAMAPHKLYETSNQRDYQGIFGSSAVQLRPSTSTFYTNTRTGTTNYNTDYGWKYIQQKTKERLGSASGQRKNNPHPLETFMVWRFSNNREQNQTFKKNQTELLDEILFDKNRTTYQMEFLGLHQGKKVPAMSPSNVLEGVTNKKSFTFNKKPTFTVNTTSRVDYQKHMTEEHKQVNFTPKFASAKKVLPAIGVVPTDTLSTALKRSAYITSYCDDFGKPQNEYLESKTTSDSSLCLSNMSVKSKDWREQKR